MKLNCVVCESKNQKHFRQVGNFELVKCAECGLVYLSDVPDKVFKGESFIEQAESALSENSKEKVEYWSFPHLYQKYQSIFEKFFQERLKRLQIYNSNLKSMLDIGCGYGFWMKFCQDKGLEVYGLDSSTEVVEWAKKNFGLGVENTPLEDFASSKQYDSIILCDILEHLINPNKELQKIKSILSENGVVYIQVPNVLGFKLPLGHGYGLPFHLWQFSYQTLKNLLEKNGFRIINHWTGVMGVIGVYEGGGPNLFERIVWKLAPFLKLGNRLQVLAEK